MRPRHLAALGICALVLLLLPGRVQPKGKTGPADPRESLEEWLLAEKIDNEDAAISFYLKMLDAGCRPGEAYRWTRMALYTDRDWNLAELAAVVEMQLLEGATRQVVEGDIEHEIRAHAAEMETDLSGFAAAFEKKKTSKARKKGTRKK